MASRNRLVCCFTCICVGLLMYGAAAAPSAPQSKLDSLRFRFGKAASRYSYAEQQLRKADLWFITGEIKSRSASAVSVWGKALSSSAAAPSHPGWLMNEGSIVVRNYDTRAINYGRFGGECVYLGEGSGTNAFGATVPVKVFGRAPAAVATYKQERKQAEADMRTTSDDLVGYVVDDCRARLKAHPGDPDCFLKCASLCWEQYAFLGTRGLDSEGLRQHCAAYALCSAAAYIRGGNLSRATEIITAHFTPTSDAIYLTVAPVAERVARREETLEASLPTEALREELELCARAYLGARKTAAAGDPAVAAQIMEIGNWLAEHSGVVQGEQEAGRLPDGDEIESRREREARESAAERGVDPEGETAATPPPAAAAEAAPRPKPAVKDQVPAAAGPEVAAAPPPGWLGIEVSDRTRGTGVQVVQVEPGSPADKAGLRPGDLIRGFGLFSTGSTDDVGGLATAVASTRPEEIVRITVYRDFVRRELPARIGARPADTRLPDEKSYAFLGATLQTKPAGGVVEIVEVQPDSPCSQAGLSAGCAILKWAGRAVRSTAELLPLIRNTPPGSEVGAEVMDAEGVVKVITIKMGSRMLPNRCVM